MMTTPLSILLSLQVPESMEREQCVRYCCKKSVIKRQQQQQRQQRQRREQQHNSFIVKLPILLVILCQHVHIISIGVKAEQGSTRIMMKTINNILQEPSTECMTKPFLINPTGCKRRDSYLSSSSTAFMKSSPCLSLVRGGAVESDYEESDDDEDEEEDIDVEEEQTTDTVVEDDDVITADKIDTKSNKLAAATIKSVSKTKATSTKGNIASAKKAVNTKLFAKSTSTIERESKKKTTTTTKLRIPYVLKAFLNPLTVFAMTRAYWASLINLNFLKKEQSQELRSAIEEKTKKYSSSSSSSSGPRGGKRKMKPGQAKSLNDLPQLPSCSG